MPHSSFHSRMAFRVGPAALTAPDRGIPPRLTREGRWYLTGRSVGRRQDPDPALCRRHIDAHRIEHQCGSWKAEWWTHHLPFGTMSLWCMTVGGIGMPNRDQWHCIECKRCTSRLLIQWILAQTRVNELQTLVAGDKNIPHRLRGRFWELPRGHAAHGWQLLAGTYGLLATLRLTAAMACWVLTCEDWCSRGGVHGVVVKRRLVPRTQSLLRMQRHIRADPSTPKLHVVPAPSRHALATLSPYIQCERDLNSVLPEGFKRSVGIQDLVVWLGRFHGRHRLTGGPRPDGMHQIRRRFIRPDSGSESGAESLEV